MRLTPTLFIPLFSCAGYSPPIEWHQYRDVQSKHHIYNIDIEELSLSGEDVTEYYYCLEHERLEEIRVVWPALTDSNVIDQP